jgi:outer membrane protein TolC
LIQNAFPIEKLKLDDVIDYALKNNIEILKAEENVSIAKQKVREARLLFLPNVVLSADYAKAYNEYPLVWQTEYGPRYIDNKYDEKDFYDLRLSITQSLYNGGKHTKMLEFAKTNWQQEKINYESIKDSVIKKVKINFYNTLMYQKIVSDINENYPTIKKIFDRIDKKSGDYFLAFKMLDEIDRTREEYQSRYEASRIELKNLTNKLNDFEIDDNFEEIENVNFDENKLIISAMEKRPELARDIYQSKLDSLNIAIAQTRRYPNIYLGFSQDLMSSKFSDLTDTDRRIRNSLFYVNISFPITYDFWLEIAQKKAEEKINNLERIKREEMIRLEITQNYRNFILYRKRCKEDREKLQQLKQEMERISETQAFYKFQSLKIYCEFKKQYYQDLYNQMLAYIEIERNL